MLHGVEWLGRQYNALSKGAAANQTLIQTITTLAARLTQAPQSDNPAQESRAALLSLKGLAKDHSKEVGAHAGKELLAFLTQVVAKTDADAAGDDIARTLVECLLAVCTPQEPPTQQARFGPAREPQPPAIPPALDQFLDSPAPLHALLPLFAPKRTFYLRFSAIQLLALLLRHRKTQVQSHVLTSPGGCGAILECLATTSSTGQSLGSSAEIIRNEALLLLPHLVDSNADIQKLIAFEGAFEKLLDVVAQEGRIEGGVVVQDALEALEALLRYNVSNQNYFRETLSIPLLAPLLFYPPPLPPNAPAHIATQRSEELERFAYQPWEYDASEEFGGEESTQSSGRNIVGDSQKLINAQLVVGVAGLLVQGSGEGRRANQNALLSTGFFHALLDLALGSSAPVPLKTQALQVLSLLLRSSRNVQDALGEAGVCPVEPIKTQLAAELTARANEPPAGQSQDGAGGEKGNPSDISAPVSPTSYEMVEYARLPPQSALITLISAALDGIPPPHRPIDGGLRCLLGFRAAAVKALQSILSDNVDARLYVLASMASSDEAKPEDQPGAVLLQALVNLPANGSTDNFNEHRALFAGMILSSAVKGAESVKALARRIRYAADGKVVILPEPDADSDVKSKGRNAKNEQDDDDDDAASLLSVLIGNLSVALRSQSDALRAERSLAADAPPIEGPTNASWTRILLGHLTLLALWLHSSPESVADLVSDSSNLQTVVRLVAEGANGEPLLVGVGAWLLGTIYEWGPAPSSEAEKKGHVTRQDIHDLTIKRIGADQFQAKLDRLNDDPRLKLVGPDVLDKISYRPDPIQAAITAGKTGQDSVLAHLPLHRDATASTSETGGKSGAKSGEAGAVTVEEQPEIWFDWTFADFWRHESAVVANSILVPPTTTSAAASATPAELLDAQQQIEQLKDQVKQLQHDVEARIHSLSDADTKAHDLENELQSLRTQVNDFKTAANGHESELQSLRTGHEDSLASLRSTHQSALDKLERELTDSRSEVTRATDSSTSALAASQERVAAVEGSLAEEKQKREAAEEQSKVLKEQLDALTQKQQQQQAESGSTARQNEVDEANKSKEEALAEVKKLRAELDDSKAQHAKAVAEAEAKLKAAEERAEAASSKAKKETSESGEGGKSVSDLEQELEDLLICLDEVSSKRKRDKQLLKEKGVDVSEDEDDEDDDDE